MIKKIALVIFVVCVLFILLSISLKTVAATDDADCFVKRSGDQLVVNGHPYYFNATNNDHPYHWSHFMIDDVLEDVKGLGLLVLRLWASSEGQNSWKDGFCFQPNPGEYHEPTFQQMDYIIAKAREKEIRLIIPLVNNWDDGYGGMPQYVRWCMGDPKDWSAKTILTFDLYNAGNATTVDVAIRTGSQQTWYESLPTHLNSGWNYNISYDLTASNWKTEASGWQYISPIGNRNQVQTFGIGVFEYNQPSAVYIDNIRFDSQLYDGLEKIGSWYATDYSYATAVEISSDYKSEGSHSLKMTYSYSAGEYNKAFAEKQPQVEKDNFYTNASCKQLYKDYINYFLNRVNTITGTKYKDDPTILMWELANEPRCESDSSGNTLQVWIDEIAGYIKSIDFNHLVSTGEEGWYAILGDPGWRYDGRLGVDYIRNHQSPYIDICSFHLYPEGYGMSDQDNLDWIQRHLEDAKNIIEKPVYLGEFGITADRKATILNDFDVDIEGWSIDWNYEGPIQVESPSRNNNGAICYIANIDAVNTSCGGRIVYPEPGRDYSGYDYFSGWVYLPAFAPADLTAEMYMYSGPEWKWASGENVPLIQGVWTQVKLTKLQIEGWGGDITKARSLGIQVKKANTNYTGEVYYDVIGANVKDIYDFAYQMSRRNQLYGDWYNSLDTQNANGAGFWQLFAHQDDGSLFPDYWNWGVYYPEDAGTSAIIQLFSALMKYKSGSAFLPTVSLDTNPASVEPEEPFAMTITAESSVPLDSVWWFVEDKFAGEPPPDIPGTVDGVACNLAEEQNMSAAKGLSSYTQTMTITIDNPGEYRIKANARDILYSVIGQERQASGESDVLVGTPNVSPQFEPMPSSYTVDERETLSFIVIASDANGDQMSLENLNPIVGATFTVGKTIILPDNTSIIQGQFIWTPARGQAGTYTVQFRARDSKGAQTDSLPIQITVNKFNHPPKVLYLRNTFNLWITWLAKDKEDHFKLDYYYRVDHGEWLGHTTATRITVKELKRQFKLKRGIHRFELQAVDSKGAKSIIKSVRFYILVS